MNSVSKNFVLFFLVSVVFWFLTKLSKEYESTISYPVSYQNLPKDKLLQESPQSEIDIHVKTTGFKILSGRLFPRTVKIDGSNLIARSKTNYYLLLSQQRLGIQKQMNTGVDIDHFIKDSVRLNLGVLSQKKVPVKLVSDISYEAGYNLDGEMNMSPDSVVISGPESVLDTVLFVETVSFIQRDLNASIESELSLKKFNAGQNINFDTEKVAINAKVEKFTEGTIKLPFTVVNLPEDLRINTFPKEIELTYKVALSKFGQVNASSFTVECDYQLSSDNNLSYLVPKLIRQSDLVKNVKIDPNKIDFVIEK